MERGRESWSHLDRVIEIHPYSSKFVSAQDKFRDCGTVKVWLSVPPRFRSLAKSNVFRPVQIISASFWEKNYSREYWNAFHKSNDLFNSYQGFIFILAASAAPSGSEKISESALLHFRIKMCAQEDQWE